MRLTKQELQDICDILFMVLNEQEPTLKFKRTLRGIHDKIGIYLRQ